MKKNHKFFSGKNHLVKNQDNSKKFDNVSDNVAGNVSFINARRNTRNFNEQNHSSFGTSPNRPGKQLFSHTQNQNRNKNKHNFNNNKHHFSKPNNNFQNQKPNFQNQKPNFQNQKPLSNNNQQPTPNNNQKIQNPEIEKYISTINFSNQAMCLLAISEQFQKVDLQKLHSLDEKLLEEAIVENNKEIVELAIIAYSYRKLISKKHIFYNPNWKKFKDKTLADLKLASELSKKQDHTEYNKKIKEIQADIEHTDKLLGHFVHDIVFNARNKLASSAYATGLSLSQATTLTSADKDSVMELIGQTKIPDEDKRMNNRSIADKVEILKKMVVIKK